MLITIPISLFAKKVILSSHGITMTARFPDPIFALTDSDDFFDELRYNRVVLRREKYEEILCDSLTVSTSSVMAQYVGDDLLGVGLRLDKWAKNFMCHAIELGVKSGTGILENVDKFYVAHGIDEWIFSREAAVKRYQRHIQKKTEKYAPKYATADFFVVPKKSHILVKNPEIRCFYLDSELEHFATAYEKKYPSLFRGSRRRAISMAKKQLRVWIWLHVGQRTPQYAAETFGLSRSQVFRSRNVFSQYVVSRCKPMPTACQFFFQNADNR